MIALLAALLALTAACDQADEAAPGPDATVPAGEGLVLGYILPLSGDLAFLGAPMIVAVQMAVDEVNDAGGVLGQPVTLLEGDEAGDEAVARDQAEEHIANGVHAVIGAAASGMSQAIIQSLYDNEIVQCSGSNTSPVFSDQDNAGFYFRTVPPDEAVAPIIADEVTADGAASVVVIARADDYGRALAGLVADELEALGASVPERIEYVPDAATFDAEVGVALDAAPDAVVVIGFREGAQVIQGLLEAGVAPEAIYGSDGLFSPDLPELVDPDDPGVLDGMKVIGASGDADFNAVIAEAAGGAAIYGGQTYDCVMVVALAAEAAGSTDPSVFVDEMIAVTVDGTECFTFAECRDLLRDGEDIDYQGASGPLELDEVGDPSFGRYAIAQFQDGELVAVGDQDVDLDELP